MKGAACPLPSRHKKDMNHSKVKEYSFGSLCPSAKDVGFQGTDGWRQRPRRIYDHQLMLCYGGSANLRIAGKLHSLSTGDLAIIKPDTPHQFWVSGNLPADVIWVHFDLEPRNDAARLAQLYDTPEEYAHLFTNPLPHQQLIRPQAVFQGGMVLPEVIALKRFEEAERLLRTLYKEFVRQGPLFSVTARILLLSLFSIIFEQVMDLGWEDRDEWVCNMLRHYINTHYFKKITMKGLAACVHMSPDYCGRIFRERTGTTLMEHVSRVRIDRARQLLLEEDLTVAQVGEMVGFRRSNHFSQVCRKVTGITPMALRRHMLSLTRND